MYNAIPGESLSMWTWVSGNAESGRCLPAEVQDVSTRTPRTTYISGDSRQQLSGDVVIILGSGRLQRRRDARYHLVLDRTVIGAPRFWIG